MRFFVLVTALGALLGCDPRSAVDAGPRDAGTDIDAASVDAGADAALPDSDAGDGVDAAVPDAGSDAGSDAGAVPLDAATMDASVPDAGPPDAGSDAGAPMCVFTSGREGATCRGGTTCVAGLTCFEELTTIPATGATLTLGNAFGIPSGMPDAATPGEFTAGAPSTVPIGFAPGGTCSIPCPTDGSTNPCGACTTCSDRLGGSETFASVGLSVRTFDPTLLDDEGLCRPNCVFDPATNGGCAAGYTCDRGENVCVEACTSDSQCRLTWGVNRVEGLVAGQEGSSRCNVTTGRCDWVPPSGAAYGSACDRDTDCPDDVGFCLLGGRCSTYQCNLDDGTGAPVYPCPATAVCVGLGGNGGALCLDECTTPADCGPGYGCTGTVAPLLCTPTCDRDAECRADERCDLRRGRTIGRCEPFCNAGTGPLPGSVACSSGEVCTRASVGSSVGFCDSLDQLCTVTADCVGGQTCELRGSDAFGRCVTP